MSKKILVTVAVVAFSLLGLDSCNKKDKAIDAAHNSENSLNWAGIYTGTIPAADCPGINVQITLAYEGTYTIAYQYIDRDSEVSTETGNFTWNKEGSTIILDSGTYPRYYKVGENTLTQQDMEGKPITGELAPMYVLKKQS